MKTTNKNRKKAQQTKIEQISKDHQIFAKKFTKYYAITFIALFIIFTIL